MTRRGRPRKRVWKTVDEHQRELARSLCPGGQHYYYLTCPICRSSSSLRRIEEASPYRRQSSEYYAIQARHRIDARQSGGPYGFFLCERESKTLAEAWHDPEFRPYVLILKKRLLEELKRFVENKIISRSEILSIIRSRA